MSFTFANPRQLWIEISPPVQAAARQASQTVDIPGAQAQIYLNQICSQVCLEWMRTEIAPTATAFPQPDARSTSWEMVTGTRIQLQTATLVIIPSDAVGKDELRIPKEWIDIPAWSATYYLAAKLTPHQDWLEIWGYASHHQVSTHGEYDAWERSYSLTPAALTTDINALWSTLERSLAPTPQQAHAASTAPSPLAALSNAQAENLINRLSSAEEAFPRLSVPFAQWGALLANHHWRQQLCTQRLARLQGETLSTDRSLSQWLQEKQQGIQSVLNSGWQSIEAIFGPSAQQLAFGFRQTEPQIEGQQAKVVRIGPSEAMQSVRLVLLWHSEADGRLGIRVQLYPAAGDPYLPVDILLALSSEQGERLQVVQAEAENNYIQLKRFKCPTDYTFQLEIQLGEQVIVEQFRA